jgi:hypothetical protein
MMPTLDDVLRPAPALRLNPEGKQISLSDLCIMAGMRNTVSTSCPPDIRLYEGTEDFKSLERTQIVYCITQTGLPENKAKAATEILYRLAYAFHNWEARDIVAAHHRHLKRTEIPLRQYV